MKEAHDLAHEILGAHKEQMDLMAKVLLERETVEGEACQALLDGKWDEYLLREGDIIAAKEREEAEARRRRAQARCGSCRAAGGCARRCECRQPLCESLRRVGLRADVRFGRPARQAGRADPRFRDAGIRRPD